MSFNDFIEEVIVAVEGEKSLKRTTEIEDRDEDFSEEEYDQYLMDEDVYDPKDADNSHFFGIPKPLCFS